MSTIKTLLEKQAQAVKANNEALKKAEQLERQAATLRAQANKPVSIPFKALRQAKDNRLERFGNAIAKDKTQQAEKSLTANGWTKQGKKWINKERPGYSLEITGETFTVYYTDKVYLDSQPLQYLDQFLTRPLSSTQKQ